ncbi:MAG: hypothetical protein IK106_02735 [Clostridiales bacterium]|nr:hypothetical protein [Clostridiales bacterium]
MAKKCRRVFALLVSVCMVSGSLCMPVLADGDPNEVTYYDSSSSTLNTRTDCVILDENNPVIADTDDGYNGTWYYLDKDIAFDDKVQVTGTTVRLILKDGCTLTANAGIDVQATYFYVYNSSSQNNGAIVSRSQDSAGIQVNSGCNIYINGGSIDSTGADGFAGIGGATDGSCGYIYIYGGNVTAQGGAGGAGIGAGSVNGYLQFSGGSIEARAGAGTAPGIGYWDHVYHLVFFEPARVDAYGGSEGGPGIGYCGNGEPNSLVDLRSVYNCAKGYVHAKGHNNAFSSLASSYGYFNNLSQWALFYGENGEKIALAEERDIYFDTLPEVWLKPCPCPDDWYEEIEGDPNGHYHQYDCQYCAYKHTNYEFHAFDAETHLCACGLGEYPVSVEGCPNGYEIIHAGSSNVVNTDGYVSSGWRLPIMMYSDDLGDIYCAKLTYVDPDISSEVVLYNDSLTYNDDYSAYYIVFFTDYQQMTDFLMPEEAVAVQVYEKYVVSFIAGEGSGSMDSVRACPYKDFVLPVNEFTPPEGSVFYGWKVNDDETIYQPGDCVALTGNAQLTAVYEDASTTPAFVAHGMELTGQIGVRFVVKYPDAVDPSTSYVEFKCSDGRTKRVNYSAATKLEDGQAFFTFNLNPLELADAISVTLHYGDGNTIKDVYSAMDYIHTVADDTTGTYDDEKDLIEALWGYGYSFQYAGWTDGMPSHGKIPWTGMDTFYEDPIKRYINRFSKEGTESAGINDVMYSLTLTSDTALHFYICLDDNETVESVEGATASGEVTISGKKYLKYTIKGIAPQNLNDLQTVTITTSSGVATLKACPMSYVYDVWFVIPMEDYDERNWKQTSLIAYYFYHRAALSYYNAHNNNG